MKFPNWSSEERRRCLPVGSGLWSCQEVVGVEQSINGEGVLRAILHQHQKLHPGERPLGREVGGGKMGGQGE